MESIDPNINKEDKTPLTSEKNSEATRSKGKFRFKRSSSSSRKHEDRSRRKRHRLDDGKYSDHAQTRKTRGPRYHHEDSNTAFENEPRGLSPGAAFRESLFDALGDDEGAAYWESIYGQPIHNYAVPQVPKGPNGELEEMTDDQYAEYVRTRMWERTREGIEAEQNRRREEQRKAQANKNRADYERAKERERMNFEQAMDDSLRRGAERKSKKTWQGIWNAYLAQWEDIAEKLKLHASTSNQTHDNKDAPKNTPLRNLLFWPVKSGKRVDVTPDAVRDFMCLAPPTSDLLATLKAERVRWHPDKMQHRYSALGIDDLVMRSVTEVFQIVDQMWNEERERKS
ncbi:hypothetical protein N7495_000421 [Penicillium taxi]|uniref:uncharacterized protein n=1 Tax=Penicillium taxi TaxID=168475 RepID=UPI00254589BB|nr:uncharacterized protein N7495_000421 [Penicillium taxi]KAJ5907739.1 hypothetical protein N7495_000421 [Penicillium taxi]